MAIGCIATPGMSLELDTYRTNVLEGGRRIGHLSGIVTKQSDILTRDNKESKTGTT